MVRNSMFQGALVGNLCVSATRWKRLSTVSGPVLRSMPGSSHLPLQPSFLSHQRRRGKVQRGVNVAYPSRHAQRLALPARQRERAADRGTERWSPTQWLQMHDTSRKRNPSFSLSTGLGEKPLWFEFTVDPPYLTSVTQHWRTSCHP